MMKLCELSQFSGKRVCVALSGGRDSVALLHFLLHAGEGRAYSVSALTCEHGIRGERSLRDLAFVRTLCKEWDVPLRVFRLDVPVHARATGQGLEEAARELRYRCFQQVLDEGEADVVLTAHHRDDFAETVLFRLLRGTSLAGLNAFPTRTGIARPLLGVTRAQIDAYVQENALPFVEDETNADAAYSRNFLRGEVFPLIEQRFERGAEHLVQFAERANADEQFLQSLAQEALTDEDCLPIALPAPVFTRACVALLKRMGVSRDYTAAHIADLEALRSLQSGKKTSLPCGVEATREYDKIIFYRASLTENSPVPFAFGAYAFGEFNLTVGEGERKGALLFDLDALPDGCVIRTREEGDEFVPFGGGRKKLKKFLTDKKIPARVGRTLPLLACGNQIYAVFGVEISDCVKLTADTVRVGYLLVEGTKGEECRETVNACS